MSQDNKTCSGSPSGTGGMAAPKTDSTASAKAAARKKQQQQKKQNAKKKQLQVVKPTFVGTACDISPMKGIVIARGNGIMSGQFRVFQKKLAGAAAYDKAYRLDSAILDLTAKKRSDFVKPKPSPLAHSDLIPIMNQME
jgi:hypothetical protein